MPTKATTKTTKKTVRRRAPKAVKAAEADVQPVSVPEVAEAPAEAVVEAVAPAEAEPAPKPEAEKAPDPNINRVYIGTHAGVEVYEGKQAWPLIREIKEVAGDDDTAFTCYEEDGSPVYVALRASALRPIAFPEPGEKSNEYGVTSVQMYGWVMTFPQTIAKIVEKETQGKPSLLSDAKKIMTLALPIVAAIFAIFVMAVALGG
jgi:hypothetical protein